MISYKEKRRLALFIVGLVIAIEVITFIFSGSLGFGSRFILHIFAILGVSVVVVLIVIKGEPKEKSESDIKWKS